MVIVIHIQFIQEIKCLQRFISLCKSHELGQIRCLTIFFFMSTIFTSIINCSGRLSTKVKKILRIYLSIRDDQVAIIMINLMLCLMKVVVYQLFYLNGWTGRVVEFICILISCTWQVVFISSSVHSAKNLFNSKYLIIEFLNFSILCRRKIILFSFISKLVGSKTRKMKYYQKA